MSEAVRTFSYDGGRRRRGGHGRRRWGCAFFLLILLGTFLGGVWWLTNDRVPLHAFVPRSEPLHAVLRNPADTMPLMTKTPVTALLHQAGYLPSRRTPWPEHLPEWAVRNFFGERLHLFGRLDEPQSLVFATRLTRLAALVERFAVLSGDFSWDMAGGLLLRRIEGDRPVYYAVRGRYLLASESRRRLITCLTLLPGEAMTEPAFAAVSGFQGTEQVRGLIRFDLGDTPAEYVRTASFSLHAGEEEVRWIARLEWQPKWAAFLAEQLGNPSPRPLPLTEVELAGFVLDAGQPLDRTADALGPLFGFDLFDSEHFWIAGASQETGIEPATLRALLAAAGPRLQLAWTGYDPYELMPVPVFKGNAQADAGSMAAFFARLPQRDPVAPPDGRLYKAGGENTAAIAMLGGPSLSPLLVLQDDALVFSTSNEASPGTSVSGSEEHPMGHFRLRARPQACFDAAAAIARQLASQGWLRDYGPAKFDEAAAEQASLLRGLQNIDLVGTFEHGALAASLTISTTPVPTGTEDND